MDEDKLQQVLAEHRLWIESDGTKWARADLSRANLSRAYLSGANLSGANLSGADLSRADLAWANLSGADLSRANLSGAYLSGAYLSGAYLAWANLSRADLSRADLSHCKGVVAFYLGKHFGLVWKDLDLGFRVKLGCTEYSLAEWVESKCLEIGKSNEYTDKQIMRYQQTLQVIKHTWED